VTDACLHVKASGTEIRARPQLYSSSPQLELDSFVTLTEAVRLRVRTGKSSAVEVYIISVVTLSLPI